MQFDSFEHALHICMTAEPDSDEQEAALVYCLENAPPEIKERIACSMAEFHKEEGHGGDCGCGCNQDHE